MSRANVARHGGDEFQARWFWLKAAKILDPNSPISGIAWESGPKSVDDIVIEYNPELILRNGSVSRDYVQCKWHVSPGLFGYDALTQPSFVNASTTSWLQRAYAAFDDTAGQSARFELKTNWHVDHADPLASLIRMEHGGIDVDKLFTGKTTKSANGAVRECWRVHLSISDDELRSFVLRLSFSNIANTLDELRENLNDRLTYAGLKPEPEHQSSFKYDDLIIKLHQQGEVSFDEAAFRAMCDREGLWAETATPARPYTIGIRSFMHHYDALEDRCDEMLDLVPYFDGRFLQPGQEWKGNIDTKVAQFLSSTVPDHDSLHLIVDSHASIAVATGRMLDVKSGRKLFVEQRVPNAGRQVWHFTEGQAGPSLTVAVDAANGGDVVLALSITHDVRSDVDTFCTRALPTAFRLDARPENGPSAISIVGGAHAWQIVEQLARELRAIPGVPGRPIHLFAAAPNALLVFLGQQLGLRPLTVYEWDLEGNRGGGYQPGLTLM